MTTRLFDDDDDQEAFGHWDEEYKGKTRIDFDGDETFRKTNRDDVPHLHTKACERLGEYIHSPRFNYLIVNNMDLTGNRVDALFRTWKKGASCTRFKEINLGKNPRIGWGVVTQKHIDMIKEMKDGDNPCIGSRKMVALASFLSNNHSLRDLSLYYVGMDLEGMQNLAPSLSRQWSLKYLDVGANFLGDAGVRVLAMALKKVKTLEQLSLCQNDISLYSSVAPMFETDGLGRYSSLKTLNLSHNVIGDQFLREMGTAFFEYAQHLEVLQLYGKNNTFTTDALAKCISEVVLGNPKKFGDAFYANHCLKEVNVADGFDNQVIKDLLAINKLQKISPAEKARQKMAEYYFGSNPLKQEILDIGIELMPYVLSVIARNTPQTLVTTRKSPTVTDKHRHDILYNMLRNWNMPSLFYHPSPDRLRIQTLEDEVEHLKEENGVLKRKVEDLYDELGCENKRLREDLQRLKEQFL